MTRVVLIDDEEQGRAALGKMLKKHCPDVNVLGTASGAREGYELIMATSPDLVFLDVEMPGGNGFDMLEMFDEITFEVVFTTAYGHYAIKAIKHSALDYLLKPVDVAELKAVIAHFTEKKTADTAQVSINALLSNLKSAEQHKKLVLPDSAGLIVVQTKDILRLESDGSYTTFFMVDGSKHLISRHLGEFESTLSDNKAFMRVHRSHLINLEHVKRYIKGEGGFAVMANNAEVEISRRRKSEFLAALADL